MNWSNDRLLENSEGCHPVEPQATSSLGPRQALSETKERSPCYFGSIRRGFLAILNDSRWTPDDIPTAFQQPARLDLRYPELECAGAQAPLVSDEIINVILPALPPTDSEQVRRDRSRTQLHV